MNVRLAKDVIENKHIVTPMELASATLHNSTELL